MMNRRDFVKSGAAASVVAMTSISRATPLGLPLGLQLYSVREPLQKDFAGTLKQVGSLGYREVEAAGFYNHSVDDVKAALAAAGLRCVSAHYPLGTLKPQIDQILPFCKSVGVEYVVCSSPMHQNESAGKAELTLDDWRWNADQFNDIAGKVNAAGMHFAYHNHVAEFAETGGALPYEVLLKNTNPAKVNFEMDCGWVIVAGHDPVQYLKQFPTRIVMLHIKDFKDNKPPSVALGNGSIDYKPIFAAAKTGHIRHCFVEQEEFQQPMMEALAIDARYMKAVRS
ncbi:Sugar phosphate isomerase [Acidisarcina polymorpha]|uniref:Sugar phosphate isomerase n=1 Tax=Acidisarcina polymorpha TaxID=2211140 RepID=A0A2Z5FU73_9BACT|nr:sugar phosphate isomerase/epimerase [Acidisarcina polymorpha]AXC10409.1 Sugar phosphate isomerase [Acidisarcina polymorpha]